MLGFAFNLCGQMAYVFINLILDNRFLTSSSPGGGKILYKHKLGFVAQSFKVAIDKTHVSLKYC